MYVHVSDSTAQIHVGFQRLDLLQREIDTFSSFIEANENWEPHGFIESTNVQEVSSLFKLKRVRFMSMTP